MMMKKRRFQRVCRNPRFSFASSEGSNANLRAKSRVSAEALSSSDLFRFRGPHADGATVEMEEATRRNIFPALRWGIFGLASLGIAACLPSFEERPWLIEESRILAIRSVPAEQRPGQPVALEALIAGPDGFSSTPVVWDFCLRPRTAVERASVSSSCLEGKDLQSIMSTAAILEDACARFGPNPPPVEGDEVGQRPADPDPSGGYFLPVRASFLPEQLGTKVFSFGQIRIRCDLAGATREIFDAFQARYSENQNPEILDLGVGRAGHNSGGSVGNRFGKRSVKGGPNFVVPSGTTIDLVAEIGASSFESYVVYRSDLGQLVEEQEELRLAWYVSAGELERGEQTLRIDDQLLHSPNVTNRWQSPQDPQSVYVWLVLRDSRGGSAWVEGQILVESMSKG